MRQSPEILAPAGSMEALTAAVHCGADAVYIGATLFSARQNAHNFDAAALREAADFCHTNGVKLYLTVNTLVFDTEWAALDELLQTAAAVGIDACIVQDLGVADYIHQRIPEMPLPCLHTDDHLFPIRCNLGKRTRIFPCRCRQRNDSL